MASPQPISERRLAANRANALKSTGPRTEAGKRRSSSNACKHHLYAKRFLLPPDLAAYNVKRADQMAAKFDDPILATLHRALWITHGYCELTWRIEDRLYTQSYAAYPHDVHLAHYMVLQQYGLLRAIYRHQTHYTGVVLKFVEAIVMYTRAQKKLTRQQAKQASGTQSNPSRGDESTKQAPGTQTNPPRGESARQASGKQTNPPHGEESAKRAAGTQTNPTPPAAAHTPACFRAPSTRPHSPPPGLTTPPLGYERRH